MSACVCRASGNGSRLFRRKGEQPIPTILREIGESQADCGWVPPKRVAAGDQWTASAPFPAPKSAVAVYRLQAVQEGGNTIRAVIHGTWKPTDDRDGALGVVRGHSEFIFDLSEGIMLESAVECTVSSANLPEGWNGRMTMSVKLESLATLDPKEYAEVAKRLRALDGAIDEAFLGDCGQAIHRIDCLIREEQNHTWKTWLEGLRRDMRAAASEARKRDTKQRQ